MQTDLEKLLTALLTVAEDNLAQKDGFGPFALLLRADADVLSFAARDEPCEAAEKALESVERWLREQAQTGVYRAVGWCAQAEIDLHSPPRVVQAILTRMEHASGEAAEVYVPYEKRGGYVYQERVVLERAPTMFATRGS
jgi:hypothetical protein